MGSNSTCGASISTVDRRSNAFCIGGPQGVDLERWIRIKRLALTRIKRARPPSSTSKAFDKPPLLDLGRSED